MSQDPTTFRATTLPFDTAHAPMVPPGHTSYTWFGHHIISTPSYSTLLGCVRDENGAKIEEKKESTAPAAAAKKAAQPQQQKKPVAAVPDVPEGTEASVEHLAALNFVVGEIKECSAHPDADSLYVEKIDLGEATGPRTIVSGLVKFYPDPAALVGQKCIVFANLAPAALRKVTSYGMVMCASNEDKSSVVLVQPPQSAKIGDRIVPVDAAVAFNAPVAEVNAKKANNYWAAVAPHLKTNQNGDVVFKDVVLGNAEGPATSTLVGCKVA